MGEGTQQSQIITLPPDNGVTAAAFGIVLVFLYNTRPDALPILPDGDDLLDVHTAARFFMLKSLERFCTRQFAESLCVDVLVRYLRYAHLHDLTVVKEMCLKYASESTSRSKDVMANSDFISLAADDHALYMQLVHRCLDSSKSTAETRRADDE